MSYTNYPKSARNNAKRALAWAEENGWGSCGTDVGKKRANDIAAGRPLSLKTVKRVYSFLSRHAENADVPYSEGCGGLMYDAWGGKSMLPWAKSIATKEDRDMEMNNKEQRSFAQGFTADVRAKHNDEDGKKKKLSGYALRFNDITTIHGSSMSWDERIAPTALDNTNMDGVLALIDHDLTQMVGKAGRNLTLEVDEVGLRVDIELNNSTKAADLYEDVITGLYEGMSFGFQVAGQDVDEDRDGLPLRTITNIEPLYEVTFTHSPAYPTTEVFARSMEAAAAEELVVEDEVAEMTEEVVEETVEVAEAPVEEVPVAEEVAAEVTEEVAEAPSADVTDVESESLAITKEELEAYIATFKA